MKAPSQPTAMQLLAKELLAEFGPQLIAMVKERLPDPANELLSVPQIAKELRVGQSTVRALIKSGTLRRVPDLIEMRVSRRELERYTSGA